MFFTIKNNINKKITGIKTLDTIIFNKNLKNDLPTLTFNKKKILINKYTICIE
jgi:hypothetical protein